MGVCAGRTSPAAARRSPCLRITNAPYCVMAMRVVPMTSAPRDHESGARGAACLVGTSTAATALGGATSGESRIGTPTSARAPPCPSGVELGHARAPQRADLGHGGRGQVEGRPRPRPRKSTRPWSWKTAGFERDWVTPEQLDRRAGRHRARARCRVFDSSSGKHALRQIADVEQPAPNRLGVEARLGRPLGNAGRPRWNG